MNIIDKTYAIAIICLGASLGALLRWSVYIWAERTFQATHFATMAVNLIGSFLIGLLFVAFQEINSPRLQLLLMTGLLASFTTFSTFSLDILRLINNGQVAWAMGNLGGQVLLGISFCYLGVKIGQKLL